MRRRLGLTRVVVRFVVPLNAVYNTYVSTRAVQDVSGTGTGVSGLAVGLSSVG